MGTAASEPRCRCVYLHHGLDPLYCWVRRMEGRGNDRPLEAGSASYRGSLRCANSRGTIAHGWSPRGKTGGCDRRVLARLIMLLRSRYRAVRIAQLSVAAGRDQRNTRAVRDGRNEGRSLPSALVACQDGSRGVSTSYLVTLLSARKKEVFVTFYDWRNVGLNR